MPDTTLQVVIKAKDEATTALKGLKGQLEGLQPAFKTMAAVGVAGFAAVSGAVYMSVKAADEAVKVQAQLGAVLKSTGGIAGITAEQAIALSKAFQKQTTYSDEAVLSMENMLLTFTNIKGPMFKDATQAVLDMSVALGQDLQGTAIQVGKALQDPILGVTALRRVGVNFNEQQRDLIKTMVESGQTMEAQQYILKELATEFGGSAQAKAKTFGGRMEQVKNQIDDLQEAIGMALIPIIEKIVNAVGPVIEKMIKWAEENPKLTLTILLVSAALTGLLMVVGLLGVALPALITGFILLTGPIGLLTLAIGLVIGALVFLGYEIYKNRDMFIEAWNAIKSFISQAVEVIKAVLKEVIDFFVFWGETIKNAVVGVFTFIGDFIAGVIIVWAELLRPIWQPIIDATIALWAWLEPMMIWIRDSLVGAWTFIKDTVVSTWNTVVLTVQTGIKMIKEAVEKPINALKELWTAVWEVIMNKVQQAWNIIKGPIDSIKNALQGIIDLAERVVSAAGRAISSVANIGAGKASFSLPSKQTGGFIPTTGAYLLHKGEYVSPAGRLSPVNITITGNTFMSDMEAAEVIGNLIIEKLKYQVRL